MRRTEGPSLTPEEIERLQAKIDLAKKLVNEIPAVLDTISSRMIDNQNHHGPFVPPLKEKNQAMV